jgi:regulatory protein
VRPGSSVALSLKGRALRYLSRREHSRLELYRKLSRHAESPEQLDRLLDELEKANLLSNSRFAESVVNRKAARSGSGLIRHELRSHGVDPSLVAAHLGSLAPSELERARALWQRRFGGMQAGADADPRDRARQARFLLSRGFASEVVRTVLGRGGVLAVLDDTPGV